MRSSRKMGFGDRVDVFFRGLRVFVLYCKRVRRLYRYEGCVGVRVRDET